jgi:hypothetical protein
MKTSRIAMLRRVLAGLALTAGMLFVAAAPANAAIVATDRPLISGPDRDFGNNLFLGTPLNGGIINWDVTGNIVTPLISGQLWLNNLSGVCHRVRVVYHDAAHNEIGTSETGLKCPPNNRTNQYVISIIPFGAPGINHVIIQIQQQNSNGSFSTVDSTTEWL